MSILKLNAVLTSDIVPKCNSVLICSSKRSKHIFPTPPLTRQSRFLASTRLSYFAVRSSWVAYWTEMYVCDCRFCKIFLFELEITSPKFSSKQSLIPNLISFGGAIRKRRFLNKWKSVSCKCKCGFCFHGK